MKRQALPFLIFKTKTFLIPSDCLYFNDISSDILYSLLTTGRYEIKSDVGEDIFQGFINNWLYNYIPDLSSENIFQYELLSDEFNRMKDIIQLYKNNSIQNIEKKFLINSKKRLQKIYEEKVDILEQNTQKHKQIINILFNNKGIETNSRFHEIRNELTEFCFNLNTKFVNFLTQKEIIMNFLSFLLDEEKGEASVFRNKSTNDVIFVPHSIEYNNKKFNITAILENSFKQLGSLKTVQFPDDSEITFIDDFSFSYSSIETISIPQKVEIIGKSAFASCHKLKTVKFSNESLLKSINENSFTHSALEEIVIPSSVERIENRAFFSCLRLKSVNFLNGSQLKYIGSSVFSLSPIISLSIPSSVEVIKEDWAINSINLTDIKILTSDVKNISYFDDTFIISKSSKFSDDYDVLHLARKDIEKAIIPSFIKGIAPFAFENCSKLKTIEFQKNSKLNTIGKCAFYSSGLEFISIPPSTTQIGESAFSKCRKLKRIEFSESSQLHSIDKDAFAYSDIESISIPSCASLFHNECFHHTQKLNSIEVFQSKDKNISVFDDKFLISKKDTKSDKYDIILFATRNIVNASIPPFVKLFAPYSFSECNQLKGIEFSDDSELEIIDEFAFNNSSLESISIPPHVTQIRQFAFSYCKNLKNIDFNDHSELKMIDESAFAFSDNLEEISIPSSVTFIGRSCFGFCTNFKKIEFSENSELRIIQRAAFNHTSLMKILVPSHIKTIEPNTFSCCKLFKKFECTKDSELQSIEGYAFSYSPLERISIPSSIVQLKSECFAMVANLNEIEIFKRTIENFSIYNDQLIIGKSDPKSDFYDTVFYAKQNIKEIFIPSFIERIFQFAFCNCKKLKKVEFENSNLKLIEKCAFKNTSLKNIKIPEHVTQICESVFANSKNLKCVDFSNNSNLKSIEKYAFANSNIESFSIPPHVTKIDGFAFSKCLNLQLIEISDDSELKTIETNVFENSSLILLTKKSLKVIFSI